MVVAPALIPKRAGERVGCGYVGAAASGRRAGVWTPDAAHGAVRDLVRAREAAADDLRRKRQQLLSFLLRHSRIYSAGGHWTLAHRRWLANQKFEHVAQQIVFQEGIDAIEDALQRLRRLERQLTLIVPDWSMAPVVDANQALRGALFLVAVTFAAEIGDVRRFDTPRQLMSFLGLVPAESSDARYRPTEGVHLGGQSTRAAGAGQGRLDLSLSGQSWRDLESPAGRAAEARARHRLEGASPPMRPLPWAQRHGQEAACRRSRNRPRDGSFPVGDRTGGHAGVKATPLFLFSAAGGARKVGNSRR